MRKLAENEWNSTVSDSALEPETMESPLDVLSRAASMVETSSRNSDSFYNANTSGSYPDSRSSPGKELPTKSLKQDRIRDRQELSGALEADREHSERLCNVKKSASTQTQFSSFSCENLPPPPYYATHDTIPHDKLHASSAPSPAYPHHLPPPPPPPPPPPLLQYSHSATSHHSSLAPPSLHPSSISSHTSSLLEHPPSQAPVNRHSFTHTSPSSPKTTTPSLPPPSLTQIRSSPPVPPQSLPPYPNSPRSCSPPPPPQYTELTRVPVDVQHAPLNLSLSSAPPIPSTVPSSRPSVIINSANTNSPIGNPDAYKGDINYTESANHRPVTNSNGGSHETAAQVSDEAIEEHFRRSLGKCYNESPPAKKIAVHVTEKICSVDDHFARALGDQMWTEIKARTEPHDALAGTVDAHFAKALGAAMWKKLKAENKLSDDVVSTQQQKQHQQQQQQQSQSPQQEEQQQPQHQQSSQHHKSPSASPLQTSLVT